MSLHETLQPNDELLGELILYTARKSANDPAFGATKLNKILFYSDFGSYLHCGAPITNHTYRRLPNGPVPRDLIRVRDDLVSSGDLAIQRAEYYGHQQMRPIALRAARLEKFTANQIAWVDSTIERLRDLSGTGVSELSHEFSGWKAAGDREEIPYETVFVYERPLTQEEEQHAKGLAQTS